MNKLKQKLYLPPLRFITNSAYALCNTSDFNYIHFLQPIFIQDTYIHGFSSAKILHFTDIATYVVFYESILNKYYPSKVKTHA